MVNYEVKIRNEFFISVLFIENMITTYFSEKLNIDDIGNSELLGSDKNSINFDQKIELLLETANFSIIDNSKLSVYREIRKDLLKNKNAENFEACLSSEDGNDNFLLILYPHSEYLPREEKLISACYQLMGEVSELVAHFTQKQEIKLHEKNFNVKNYLNFNSLNLSKLTFLFSFLFLK